MIGKVINKYRVDQKIGEGGMGVVYRAWDTVLERPVALKMINPVLAQNETFFRRFLVEAKTLAKLEHPHIVNVFDMLQHEEYWFIVMQYIQGMTLAQKIAQEGAMPCAQALSICRQILSAIGYAHRAGIVHRDVKPNNVLLTREGTVKVTDFGLAKYQYGTALTHSSTTGGTLRYMSPEQIKNLAHVDHRSDIYSIGMTLYEMLAGQTPFPKNAPDVDILNAVIKTSFSPPSQFAATLPPPVDRIVMKAIAKAPNERFQNAEEMAKVIQAFEGGEKISLPPPKSTMLKRARWLIIGLLTAITLAAVFINRERIMSWFNAPKQVPISILTTPAGARILLNRKEMGLTPLENQLVKVGMVPLLLEKEGYLSVDTTLAVFDTTSIFDPRPLLFSFVLSPAAVLAVDVEPSGAKIFLGTGEINRSDWKKVVIAPGTYILTIMHEGYIPVEDSVTFAPGFNPPLHYPLKKAGPVATYGDITITSEPSDAAIELKGPIELKGKTPYQKIRIPTGKYQLLVRMSKHETISQMVVVDSNRISSVQVKLQPLPGRVKINVNPRSAIYLNDTLVINNTDSYENTLAAGMHRLKVVSTKGNMWEVSVRIEPEEEYQKDIDFSQEFELGVSAFDIASEPLTDGEIYVDGERIEETTPARFKLSFGQHTIDVRLQGYQAVDPLKQISLELDLREPLVFRFRKSP